MVTIMGNGRIVTGSNKHNIGANIKKKKIAYLKTPLLFISGITDKIGTTIILTYEDIIVGGNPDINNFDIVYNGTIHNTPLTATYLDNTVILTLATPPTNLQDVTVSFTGDSVNNIGRIIDEPITNFVTVDYVSGANDVLGTTITLNYESDIVGTQPDVNSFDVIYDGTAHQVPLTSSFVGSIITLTVATAPTALQVVTFSNTIEATNNIGVSTGASITNNVV